jgi:hypothetical protein
MGTREDYRHATPAVPSRFASAVRRWTGNFLVLLAFLGLISTTTIRNADVGIFLTAVLVCGGVLVATGVGIVGRRLAMTGRKQRAHLLFMLRPVFDQLSVAWSKPRLGAMPVVFVLVWIFILCMFVAMSFDP